MLRSIAFLIILALTSLFGQSDGTIRGFFTAAPKPDSIERFVTFIEN